LVTVIPACFKDIDNAEIIRETRPCCKSLEAGCPWEMSAARKSRIHICKEATRRLKHSQKSFTEEARSYVTKELWAVSYNNPVRINTVVIAITK
jgi:hypothetical protein